MHRPLSENNKLVSYFKSQPFLCSLLSPALFPGKKLEQKNYSQWDGGESYIKKINLYFSNSFTRKRNCYMPDYIWNCKHRIRGVLLCRTLVTALFRRGSTRLAYNAQLQSNGVTVLKHTGTAPAEIHKLACALSVHLASRQGQET